MIQYYQAVHIGSAEDESGIKGVYAQLLQQYQKHPDQSQEAHPASHDAIRLYHKLMIDKRIVASLKGLIQYFLSENELENQSASIKRSLEAIQGSVENESHKVIDSILLLKRDYQVLYQYRQDLYDAILESAQLAHKTNTQWYKLINDQHVLVSLKCLVGIWLTHNMPETEREFHFNSQMDELSRQPSKNIQSSLKKLRKSYPVLYQQCASFLSDLNTRTKEPFDTWKWFRRATVWRHSG